MTWIRLLITVPLTAASVLFAIVNTEHVIVHSPFYDISLSLPIYFIALGPLALGFLCGALFVWLNSRKTAFNAWRTTRQMKHLEKELEQTKKKKEVKTLL